ncbi:MAG: hypothetical protein PUI31_05305 [Clostridia bacterium]|nr:hypothetical protein [Clostridia bacterium]MDY2901349.1 hypothetical protein [Christensenellaceae bacterium]
MSNNKKTNLLVWGVVAAVAMIILSVVGFILAMTGVFAVNEFLLGFMILSAGLGIVFFVYGLVVKGGYETATGYILFCVGLTLLFVALEVKWYGILLIDFALLLVGLAILILLKSKSMIVERTDEKPGYKSFYEQKAEKDAEEKAKEEAAPEITFKHPSEDILDKKDKKD